MKILSQNEIFINAFNRNQNYHLQHIKNMQKGFEGNKTQLIEKEAQRKVDDLQFIRIDDMIDACKKAKAQKMMKSDSRLNGKEFDSYRYDVALSYLSKLIERANKEGLG